MLCRGVVSLRLSNCTQDPSHSDRVARDILMPRNYNLPFGFGVVGRAVAAVRSHPRPTVVVQEPE